VDGRIEIEERQAREHSGCRWKENRNGGGQQVRGGEDMGLRLKFKR
jgi:hypothetical protein